MYSKFRMSKKTPVNTVEGKVLVSTISLDRGQFETMVFPIGNNDLPDFDEIEIYRTYRPKIARKIHKEMCKKYYFSLN